MTPRLHVRSLWRRVADLERLLHKSSCAAFTPMNETTVQRKLVEGANLLALRRRYLSYNGAGEGNRTLAPRFPNHFRK